MIDTKALREKILDLAIRGKLVPQDPNDEPASVLLERIRAQKQQMVKEGKLKAKDIKNDTIIFKGEDNLHYEQFQDGTVKCIEDEIPFDVPDGWEWTRLCSVSYDLPYGTSKKSSTNGKIAVLRMGNLQNGEIDYSDLVYSSDEEDIKKYYLIKGDLLFNRTNSIELVGKTSVYRGDIPAIYAGYLIRIRSSLNYEYLNAVMNSSYAREYCTSVRIDAVNQSNINATKLGHFLIAIPSKSEQKRISKKIAESIKVINIIEQEKLDLQAITANVKSKILDLAIRGKLVPQDPNDESASVLLERIRAEKEELIKQGKIKRDKKESVIFKGEDNSYYQDLPENWEITTLRKITTPLTLNDGDWILSENMSPNGEVKLLQLGSIGNMVYIDKGFKYLSKQTFNELSCTTIFPKYLLINRIISDKMCCCIIPNIEGTIITTVDTCWIAPCSHVYNLKFLMYQLASPVFQSMVLIKATGTTRKRISKSNLIDLPLLFPPLVEQNRIVEAIETAFAQLDEIANSIA